MSIVSIGVIDTKEMTQPSAIKGVNYKIDRDISPKPTKKVSKRRKRNSGCSMVLGYVWVIQAQYLTLNHSNQPLI